MLPALLRRTVPVALAGLLAAGLPAIASSADAASGRSTRATSVAASLPAAAPSVARGVDDAVAALATPLTGFRLDRSRRVNVPARSFFASRIDDAVVRSALAGAPSAQAAARGAAPVRVSLPAPDGTEVVFAMVEDSVMEPGLQAAHPELRTYAGTGVTDPSDTIRLAVTPLGLSASVRNIKGNRTWYVDPAYYGRGVTTHLSYLRSAVPRSLQAFPEREITTPARASLAGRAARVDAARRAGEVVVQRTYRMAFVTTPSYAADFGTANVLAEKVRVINRANAIYMDDMAIKFVLVDGTDKLNLDTAAKATGANGPCGANACFAAADIASCGGDGIDRNNFVAGQIIGADGFDIGHLGSGEGGGGVAYLGVVGGELKAGGCTALDEPRGDFYAIDFFAHEVGHQMGGNHTFDGNNGSCMAPNRNAETSVEPGSGTSVMAYAGICTNDDLQPHTDPYFSQRTIDEFTAVTTAKPTTLAEQQVVNLSGFGGTDSFQLGYPGKAPITITNGTNYTVAGLEAALLLLTGKAVQVTAYDGAMTLDTNGFTADWPDQADAERLTLSGFNGATGFVGVTLNGGPITNQGTATTTTDHRPVVAAGADKSIPIQTPFVLTGSATDAESAQQAGLTYLWEQNDPGLPGDPVLGTGPGTNLSQPVKLAGPLFRVFGTYADVSADDTLLYNSPGENLVDGNPSRSFPDLAQVLADNTNAEGPCPLPADPSAAMTGATLDCYSEFLPDAAYATSLLAGELNFRLTVRDGAVTGGGTGYDDVVLTPDPTVGPFAVTSRATAGTPATASGTETVTWDVAGTDAAAFAPLVRISVSIDGGTTFPYVVAASTPNDGTEDVTLPKFNTTKARIKIEAIDNYFYDTNDADFVIQGGVDLVPPQTTITSGVAKRGFVASYRASYGFASSLAGSTFACTLDGASVPCGNGSARLRGLKPGTHVFKVAATSADGLVDPTPARREFAVLANERLPVKRSPGWKNVKDQRFYRATYFSTREKGRTLSYRVSRASRIAVLFARGKGLGRVAIELNGKRLKVVDLSARRPQLKVLYASGSFAAPRSGTLTLRTLDRKPVVIDGVGSFVIPPS
ncbi:M12 family metallo-peptidase [Nocardioides rubriscoriae]|uniref:M12 family metallo-peptidase n=1 Tax=Nocardioides rubriscoriae TaxID=642762 RepID=UPI0011E05F5B|nr:M12 family metallo-peptidase [Nocardioides rubriscoriae]